MEGDIEVYEGFHGIKTSFFSRREEIGYDIGYRRFQDPPNNAKKKMHKIVPGAPSQVHPYLA